MTATNITDSKAKETELENNTIAKTGTTTTVEEETSKTSDTFTTCTQCTITK